MTLADVLEHIKRDLEWRGPTDRSMGHIILTRDEAEYLHRAVIAIIIERDELVFQKDQSKP